MFVLKGRGSQLADPSPVLDLKEFSVDKAGHLYKEYNLQT